MCAKAHVGGFQSVNKTRLFLTEIPRGIRTERLEFVTYLLKGRMWIQCMRNGHLKTAEVFIACLGFNL